MINVCGKGLERFVCCYYGGSIGNATEQLANGYVTCESKEVINHMVPKGFSLFKHARLSSHGRVLPKFVFVM